MNRYQPADPTDADARNWVVMGHFVAKPEPGWELIEPEEGEEDPVWVLHNGRHEKLTDFGGNVIEEVFS